MTGSITGLSGTFANRYVIERELGRGGTAAVYLARDLQRGHEVAVKVLRPDLQEALGADRNFLREMRLSQQLNHPHVVPVLDAGSHDGQLYFVHPYMEGGTLRARMARDKQLPLTDVVAITRTVAAALAYAHEKGVVHRDVKPENILFTSGQACLSDFGIARALERTTNDGTTTTSVVRGTPWYMSPEQAAGERDLDARTDQYALACVVYEMIAGMQPFVGPTPQSVIAQRLTSAPQRVSVYRPGVPGAVEAVLDRALAIARSDRYQSVAEFADALAAAMRPEPAGAAPVSRLRRLRPHLLGAGVAVAIGLVWMASRRVDAPATTGIPEGDPRRVAVLYLDDRTPDLLPVHVADGISEDLIDQLGGIRALHVVSPYGVRPFRGVNVTLDSVTRVLRVGTLVSGNIARAGNTVRVNVRFVDAQSGQQLDSKTLEQPWTEVFSLRDQLVEQVAFFLRQQIGEQIAVREQQRQTTSYAAWELTQRARADHLRAIDPRGGGSTMLPLLLSADSLYARAQQFDPQWPVPTIRRGSLAAAMATQAFAGQPTPAPPASDSARYAALPRTERVALWLGRAIALADQALGRTGGSAEAFTLRGESRLRLTMLGGASDSLFPVIERDLRAAVDLRPDGAAAWVQLARLWVQEGRFADAASAAQRAADADPFYEVRGVTAIAFTAALHAEMFDAAERWCRLGLSRYPGDPRFAECELTLAGWTGKSRSDVANAQRLLAGIEQRDTLQMLAPTWAYRRLLVAAVMARAGMRDSARALLASVQARQATEPTRAAASLGEPYVLHLLGENDAAIAALGEYLRAAPTARAQLAQHPWFRALRADPRFQALVRTPTVTTVSPGSSRSSR